MAKQLNKYRLVLEQIESKSGETAAAKAPLHLEFENHDELFEIIERAKKKNLFGDVQQSIEFVIGLKMFSEVMLKNRNLPLFEEFSPAFKEFMKKLKQH